MKSKVTIKQRLEGDDANMMLPSEISVEAVLYKDGDKWCCLVGENIQEGCSGFGDTPGAAMQNCAEECGLII